MVRILSQTGRGKLGIISQVGCGGVISIQRGGPGVGRRVRDTLAYLGQRPVDDYTTPVDRGEGEQSEASIEQPP
eukprot:gene16218-biopygen4544